MLQNQITVVDNELKDLYCAARKIASDAYQRGWRDGMAAMQRAIQKAQSMEPGAHFVPISQCGDDLNRPQTT